MKVKTTTTVQKAYLNASTTALMTVFKIQTLLVKLTLNGKTKTNLSANHRIMTSHLKDRSVKVTSGQLVTMEIFTHGQ